MDSLVIEERHRKPSRKVILLVEEDFLTRWSAAEYLRETGLAVIEAVSAVEALAAIRAGSEIDAVFCSAGVFLETSGHEFLRCLEQHATLPVLLAAQAADLVGSLAPKPTRANIRKPYALSDVERDLNALIAAR
jgi:DNA-binding NtrC family response regulator